MINSTLVHNTRSAPAVSAVKSDSECESNIMRNDSPDDESSSTNETLMEQQTAELLEEFEKIEEEYENYTTAGSDDRERGDTDVEPAVTLQANMLNGETTSLEVMDMESVKMIKDQLIIEFKLNPTSKTKLICGTQELQDNQFVAQFPCHDVTIIVESIVETQGVVLMYNYEAHNYVATPRDFQPLDKLAATLDLPNFRTMCTSTRVYHGNKPEDFVLVQFYTVHYRLHEIANQLPKGPTLFNHYDGQFKSVYIWVHGVEKPPSVTTDINLLQNVPHTDISDFIIPLQRCLQEFRTNIRTHHKHEVVLYNVMRRKRARDEAQERSCLRQKMTT